MGSQFIFLKKVRRDIQNTTYSLNETYSNRECMTNSMEKIHIIAISRSMGLFPHPYVRCDRLLTPLT
ncbi:hypothetical protein PRUPE_3G183200 [Prunus persica]|uniref:Uncharacterized protein n=1 Tax=Prunus persica TaxID=3760 RepID=A0A251Q239_PRUPE|nr:hypothetical protein PRUPE_3G183200 [Prunus persica]